MFFCWLVTHNSASNIIVSVPGQNGSHPHKQLQQGLSMSLKSNPVQNIENVTVTLICFPSQQNDLSRMAFVQLWNSQELGHAQTNVVQIMNAKKCKSAVMSQDVD